MPDPAERHPELADQVVRRRRALGLNQQDLADLAEVSERFVRELEHGKQTVRLDKLLAVMRVLGLELDVRVAVRP